MKNNIFYVYEHWRLDKDECFYVGKGNGNRAYSVKSRNAHWRAIVSKLERIGSGYEVRLVDTGLNQQEAFQLEIERIAFWDKRVDLANILPGGQNGGGGMSGKQHSKQTIEKMRISQKGRVITEVAKEKIRNALIGRKASDETKSKLSAIRKGVPRPDLVGRKASEETRRKMSETRTGRKHSEETKAKIRESNLRTKAMKKLEKFL